MRKVILLVLFIFVMFCGLYFIVSQSPTFRVNLLPLQTSVNTSIRIHLYNKPEWLHINMIEDYCDLKCHITTGKDSYNDSDIHVVVFHAHDFTKIIPTKHNGQIWVLFSNESPRYTKFSRWRYLFNWTITMRRDADLPYFIGAFMPKSKFTREGKQEKYIKTALPIQKYFANDSTMIADVKWTSKNKSIGWFVSHCRTASKRETYVKKLSAFINVDIYGKCGKHVCPKNKSKSLCFESLMQNCKMYTSFENSLCRDYITEKSYKIYTNLLNTIPIVRGGANYSLFLPPGSYINTDDFKDILSLGKTLQNLYVNRHNAAEHFNWRRHYVPYNRPYQSFCELCRRMHKGPGRYRALYDDVGYFMKGEGYQPMCYGPKDLK